jgi:hypothetical protein
MKIKNTLPIKNAGLGTHPDRGFMLAVQVTGTGNVSILGHKDLA